VGSAKRCPSSPQPARSSETMSMNRTPRAYFAAQWRRRAGRAQAGGDTSRPGPVGPHNRTQLVEQHHAPRPAAASHPRSLGACEQHNTYGSALTAQPGWSQGRPDNNTSSQLIKYHGLPNSTCSQRPCPGRPKIQPSTQGVAGIPDLATGDLRPPINMTPTVACRAPSHVSASVKLAMPRRRRRSCQPGDRSTPGSIWHAPLRSTRRPLLCRRSRSRT
jgi:hypothetical protein